MTPRRSPKGYEQFMLGTPLDNSPAEIAAGIFVPHTRYEVEATVNGCKVTARVRIVNREPICESLTISSVRNGSPVTASSLRTIPLAGMIRYSLSAVGGFPFSLDGEKRVPIKTQESIEARDAESRPKRTPRSDVLPRVVEEYKKALANPSTRDSATQTVANHLHYQRGYVSRLLSEARRTDPPMLGPAKAGKSGEWLEDDREGTK
jgi:hypothetical protein